MNDFVGEFAHEKLDELIKRVNLKEKLEEEAYQQLKAEVDRIGDDFIREKLIEKLNERISRMFALTQERERLQDKIKQIDAKIAKYPKTDDSDKIQRK